MANNQENSKRGPENQDFYFVVNDKEHDFYWVLNLLDHPSSFLLDHSYHQFASNEIKEDQDSMIIIQPTA